MTTTVPAGLSRSGPSTPREAVEHSGELVRLGLAVVVFVLSLLAIQQNNLTVVEADVFRLVNDLPDWLMQLFWVVMQFGDMLAPIVIGLVVIFAVHRTHIGLSVMLAGAGGWALAQVLKYAVERGRPEDFLDELMRVGSSGGPGFISGHTAVSAAMAAVIAPNLPRRWRRVVWAVPVLVGMGRMYLGVHLPLDVVGGFAVGWFVGTLVHMQFGVDPPIRTPETVAGMLNRIGLDVTSVQPAQVQAKVSHPFRVMTSDGRRLFAKVLDHDPRSTDWVLRLARLFASRERRDISALARLPEAADHEATVTMAARNTGARVPRVVVARGDGANAVVVLEEVPGGVDLSEVAAEVLNDEVLEDLWHQVALLRRGRVAHRDLVRGNVLLDQDGRPWVGDFFDGQVGASDDSLDGDVAELIASLAVAAGPERAVSSAAAVLGGDAVVRALPRLEAFALSPRTRRELTERPGLLDEVRAAGGAGPEATSTLVNVHRLVLPAVTAAAGYGALLAIVGWGSARDELSDTLLRWVAVAGVALLVAPLLHGYAITLPLRRRVAPGRSAVAAGVASSAEVIGGIAARRRYLRGYLRSCGARRQEPEVVVDQVVSSELVAMTVMVLGTLVVGSSRGQFAVDVVQAVPGFLAVAVVAAIIGAVMRRVRRADPSTTPRRRAMRHALENTRRDPVRAFGVLAAVTGAELALVVALASALHVVGPWPSLAVVALALAGARLLMAVAGLAAVPALGESLCAAGLSLLGVPPTEAAIGVIIYAVFRYWVTGLASILTAPRLAPLHVPDA